MVSQCISRRGPRWFRLKTKVRQLMAEAAEGGGGGGGEAAAGEAAGGEAAAGVDMAKFNKMKRNLGKYKKAYEKNEGTMCGCGCLFPSRFLSSPGWYVRRYSPDGPASPSLPFPTVAQPSTRSSRPSASS